MTDEEIKAAFEAWYKEEYSFQIWRGGRGRSCRHLETYEGTYISDLTANDFKVWCAAYKRMNK